MLIHISGLCTLLAPCAPLQTEPAAAAFPLSGAVPIEVHSHGHSACPDSLAPIGIMGDHLHAAGEWMLTYRFMSMRMDGNRDGHDSLDPAEVLGQGFMVSPTKMTMQMHMFGAMYAPSDKLTLMAMVPIVAKSMDHLTGMGTSFTTETEGLSDVRLSALFPILQAENQMAHLNLGLSLPTGSIDERGATPMGPDSKLPYPMQLGSGTYDLLAGATWMQHWRKFSVGARWIETVRLGENDEHYTLGNEHDLSTWAAYAFHPSFSSTLRLDFSSVENIDGADPELNPAVVPTARPDLRGGERLDLGLGFDWRAGPGRASGLRFALEYLIPVYQYLDGPQLEVDGTLVAGLQYSL